MIVTIRDYSDEYSRFSVEMPDLGTSDLIDLVLTDGSNLATALSGAILGTIVNINWDQVADAGTDTRPASGEAQREKKLRLSWREDVNNRHGAVEIPTADFGVLAQPGTDLVPLDHAEVAPIVSWIEGNMEVGGQSVTVERAELVGRAS